MKNTITVGHIIPYVNGSGSTVTAGSVVRIGDTQKFGVVADDIIAGATGSVYIEGVFLLDKIASETFAQGAMLYWDLAVSKLSALDTNGDDDANISIGMAWLAAASTTTTAQVKLNKDSYVNPA